jgi:hypothetical protein
LVVVARHSFVERVMLCCVGASSCGATLCAEVSRCAVLRCAVLRCAVCVWLVAVPPTAAAWLR